jgi:hypothetical protein
MWQQSQSPTGGGSSGETPSYWSAAAGAQPLKPHARDARGAADKLVQTLSEAALDGRG